MLYEYRVILQSMLRLSIVYWYSAAAVSTCKRIDPQRVHTSGDRPCVPNARRTLRRSCRCGQRCPADLFRVTVPLRSDCRVGMQQSVVLSAHTDTMCFLRREIIRTEEHEGGPAVTTMRDTLQSSNLHIRALCLLEGRALRTARYQYCVCRFKIAAPQDGTVVCALITALLPSIIVLLRAIV